MVNWEDEEGFPVTSQCRQERNTLISPFSLSTVVMFLRALPHGGLRSPEAGHSLKVTKEGRTGWSEKGRPTVIVGGTIHSTVLDCSLALSPPPIPDCEYIVTACPSHSCCHAFPISLGPKATHPQFAYSFSVEELSSCAVQAHWVLKRNNCPRQEVLPEDTFGSLPRCVREIILLAFCG